LRHFNIILPKKAQNEKKKHSEHGKHTDKSEFGGAGRSEKSGGVRFLTNKIPRW
jgi:hypothetical protein